MPLTTDAYKCNGSGYENFLLSEIHVHAPQKRQNTKSFLLFQERERNPLERFKCVCDLLGGSTKQPKTIKVYDNSFVPIFSFFGVD